MSRGTPNYRDTYDEFWEKADRIDESNCDLASIAELVVQTCGVGSILDVGSGEGFLVDELLKRGVDAFGIDVSDVIVTRSNSRLPGRFQTGSVLALPYPDEQFQTLVSTECMEHLAPEDVSHALREMFRVSSKFVFLQIATTPDRDSHWRLTVESRLWWEGRCFEAGFRKHPAYYEVNPYEALNSEPSQIYILLEKLPTQESSDGIQKSFDKEHLLHRDMLRETGRRSDAHCIRYYMASQYIRPGDVVLDVACGLGYGSHLLHFNSQARSVLGVDLSEQAVAYAESNYGIPGRVEFHVGDAERLVAIEDNSVDFIAAFETIEHVPRPTEYLKELKRVLKPSGRVMICAPSEWVDETGKDPNPHHLHIYSWERLRDECLGKFLIEKSFLQTAGGAMKCHHSPRKWLEIDPSTTPIEEAEWSIFLCMKDPLEGNGVPYTETTWEIPESPDFNVSAFARDYVNPWLVKGIVAIGLRSQSPKILNNIQKTVLETSEEKSPDFGAALCGLVYGKLAQSYIDSSEYERMLGLIREYAKIPAPGPHQLRWQVSLLFAGGELARIHGNLSDARAMYEECANKDVLAYSPLLGNRILDALHWLAVLAVGGGDYEEARTLLLRAVQECQRLSSSSWLNVVGDINHPLPFGLAEMAQLMDKGSRAAYMLTELDSYPYRPKTFIAQSSGFLERQIAGLYRDRTNLSAAVSSLKERVLGLQAHAQELAREVARQDAHAQELAREVARQDAHAQELAREVARQDDHAQGLAREVAQLNQQEHIIRTELETVLANNRQLEHQLKLEQSKTLWQHLKRKVRGK